MQVNFFGISVCQGIAADNPFHFGRVERVCTGTLGTYDKAFACYLFGNGLGNLLFDGFKGIGFVELEGFKYLFDAGCVQEYLAYCIDLFDGGDHFDFVRKFFDLYRIINRF